MYGRESTHEFLGPSVPSSFGEERYPGHAIVARRMEARSKHQRLQVDCVWIPLKTNEYRTLSDKIRYDQSSCERVVEAWKRYPEEGSATGKQITTWDGYRLTSSYRIVASSLHIWDMTLFLWLGWYGLSYMINMISHTHITMCTH